MRSYDTKRRPMVKASKVGLFNREIIERLSPVGIEIMLALASKVSEGQISSKGSYFGSTIITINLSQLSTKISEPCDPRTADRLAHHINCNESLLSQFSQIGKKEAGRIAKNAFESFETEIHARADGVLVYVDIDVEGVIQKTAKTG